ncbi:unnamed protein product [Caenorhabditis sp. 36 PRJEB53466]|nr:unnamed protein product [Caenorhabditis sp. 36 PRJEB53466]
MAHLLSPDKDPFWHTYYEEPVDGAIIVGRDATGRMNIVDPYYAEYVRARQENENAQLPPFINPFGFDTQDQEEATSAPAAQAEQPTEKPTAEEAAKSEAEPEAEPNPKEQFKFWYDENQVKYIVLD